MHERDAELILSATDLSAFLACRHRTALDLAVARGARKPSPYRDDAVLQALRERGEEHETRYVELLRAAEHTIVDLGDTSKGPPRLAATLQAMREGADVIVQGALCDGPWFGYPDVLRKVPGWSAFGEWAYEVADTKLARDTSAGTILQLSLYSAMLAQVQGAEPNRFYVVTPYGTEAYRIADYAAYFRTVRARMLAAVGVPHDELAEAHYPEPVDHCQVCRWWGFCSDRRRADDHLSLVAGASRLQWRELESRDIGTVTRLAALPVPIEFRPRRGSRESYERVAHQARLQVASRGRKPPLHELLDVEPDRGLSRLPEPSPGDLFLDLEKDSFAAEGGREYLFGFVRQDGSYIARWAFTEAEERRAFEWAMDLIAETAERHPDMHVYHYSAYEPSAFKRLMGRHATRGNELDAMLRAGRFVDLYAVVRQGLRAGVERYSIKDLEPLYDFHRDVELPDANRQLRALEAALERGVPIPDGVRAVVEGYNRDDCVSTIRLRDWLESLRASLIAAGKDVPRAEPGAGDAPEEIGEKARAVAELRDRLLAGVPEDRAERNPAQQARWIAAYLLDYHRREDRATWWEYFRLGDLATEELYDEREAVAGLELVERVEEKLHAKTGKPTGTVVDRYRYPDQEMEIDAGSTVWLERRASAELAASEARERGGAEEPGEIKPVQLGTVVDVDRRGRTIDISKGPRCADVHPSALFAFTIIRAQAMEDSLMRIGTALAGDAGGYEVARALLEGHSPRLAQGTFGLPEGEDATMYATRIAGELDRTVLAVQGPPGAGKTYCGAEMILALVRQGRRVGVTANSHKVIRHLLEEVLDRAKATNTPVSLGHKCDGDDLNPTDGVRSFGDNASAHAALTGGEVQVLGGTAWMWSRPEFAGSADTLVVDEAGQMALANVVAVSPAGASLVLLGDPRQLEQPMKATHPDGVGVSALEHLLGDSLTMPADRGLFLPHTRRLAPKICEFTSDVFYDGRLESLDGLECQTIVGIHDLPPSGLAIAEVPHEGNRNASEEEVDAVASLVSRLTSEGARWIDADGIDRPLGGDDILVVAPYNAQVTRLTERLAATGVRVGTVDKFQGQQAPVVIYTMATSSPDEAPRGIEFLYSLNRLNVATSRAKCLAIVVASPALLEAECRTPRQIKLVNALCRFREMAVRLA